VSPYGSPDTPWAPTRHSSPRLPAPTWWNASFCSKDTRAGTDLSTWHVCVISSLLGPYRSPTTPRLGVASAMDPSPGAGSRTGNGQTKDGDHASTPTSWAMSPRDWWTTDGPHGSP